MDLKIENEQYEIIVIEVDKKPYIISKEKNVLEILKYDNKLNKFVYSFDAWAYNILSDSNCVTKKVFHITSNDKDVCDYVYAKYPEIMI